VLAKIRHDKRVKSPPSHAQTDLHLLQAINPYAVNENRAYEKKKKKEKICSVKRDTITARFLIQQRERDESPWREKINLMANEFLPSRAPGQLRRGVEEGPENGGMTGRPWR